ncbi:MAG: hypothetical protein ACU0DI_11930 [Paracoccaceae bacterium]
MTKKFAALLRDFDEFTGWRFTIEAIKPQILAITRPGEARGVKKQEFYLVRPDFYKERKLVERFFNKLKYSRAISIRYEKPPTSCRAGSDGGV